MREISKNAEAAGVDRGRPGMYTIKENGLNKWRKDMPRRRIPKQCACGCGELTAGGDFKPGHDSKTLSAILEHVGGVLDLKTLVEKHIGKTIKVKHD